MRHRPYKFLPGQRLYYKPGDFAPLQASAGGVCTVLRQLEGIDGDNQYCVRLDDQERIVKERDLSELQPRRAAAAR